MRKVQPRSGVRSLATANRRGLERRKVSLQQRKILPPLRGSFRNLIAIHGLQPRLRSNAAPRLKTPLLIRQDGKRAFVARMAGIIIAPSATIVSTAPTLKNVRGSVSVIPNNILFMNRVSSKQTPAPISIPPETHVAPRDITIPTTRNGVAPNAIRTASSRVD
jgi:hypothetical protein